MRKKLLVKAAYLLIFSLSIIFICTADTDTAITVSADGYIKWVDFNATSEVMRAALKWDIESYERAKDDPDVSHARFAVMIAIAAAKCGGDFSHFKVSEIDTIAERLMSGDSPNEISKSEYLPYFLEAYDAVLGGFVGQYATMENGVLLTRYGLKVFSPIAAGYYYRDYDDFGASRSYGYRRHHLGHDLMGSVGTPIIAVESGYVEACGWNQYGGWRIGIRSFDGKRYYYYAHLRRDHPYNDIYEGKQVNAGEVIGYLGMTGYSAKENVNGIDDPHLHFGVQLIFDPVQKEGINQIWIDLYEYTKFLSKYRCEVAYDKNTGEFYSVQPIIDLSAPD